jgi:selenide,water dikinase
MVNDPYSFGQIAAANSLSDVYAMGGEPVTALNLVGFPSDLDTGILRDILRGGFDKATEAGAVILGGHTVVDKEIKYGLSVTGVLPGENFTPNSGAKTGELLVLTKPLGIGIITTAIKRDIAPADVEKEAIFHMSRLNKNSSAIMREFGAGAATDITGFGLLGHARNLAEASGVTIRINSQKVPVIPGTMELLEIGAYPGGSKRNRQFADESAVWSENISEQIRMILVDAQTSGGLLICISPEKAEGLKRRLIETGETYSEIIGEVIPRKETLLEII